MTNVKPWYVALYENYGRSYSKEPFITETVAEVDFIERAIAPQKSCRVLDVGCGTGRHSLELARRGHTVVGVDLSDSMLKQGRQQAATEGLQVSFQQGDACNLNFSEEFDLVIVICEGAFSLMESDEKDHAILQGIANALKPDGKLVLTAGNALFPLTHGLDGEFDIITLRETGQLQTTDDDGRQLNLAINQRFYLPSELTWRLKSLGFEQPSFFGSLAEGKPLTTHDFELVAVAIKQQGLTATD